MNKENLPQNIDEYIAAFPKDVREMLEEIRAVINKTAPEAIKKISCQMPTFFLKGNLVHFAAFTNHIGFYATPFGIEKFKDEISKYKLAKGSVQFPIDKPLPLNLITKIVKYRVKKNE